jgi:dienelactone hydrolase family protein
MRLRLPLADLRDGIPAYSCTYSPKECCRLAHPSIMLNAPHSSLWPVASRAGLSSVGDGPADLRSWLQRSRCIGRRHTSALSDVVTGLSQRDGGNYNDKQSGEKRIRRTTRERLNPAAAQAALEACRVGMKTLATSWLMRRGRGAGKASQLARHLRVRTSKGDAIAWYSHFPSRGRTFALVRLGCAAYGALLFLARQSFVNLQRVAAVGFSAGAWVTLSVAEPNSFELFVPLSNLQFQAAAAFYPPCQQAGARPGIPTLIFIGALDDWTPAPDCSNKVTAWGNGGPPIELVVYPGVHHSFLLPALAARQDHVGSLAGIQRRGSGRRKLPPAPVSRSPPQLKVRRQRQQKMTSCGSGAGTKSPRSTRLLHPRIAAQVVAVQRLSEECH